MERQLWFSYYTLSLNCVGIFCVNVVWIWSSLLRSSSRQSVRAARLPPDELMPPCPRAPATRLWFIRFFFFHCEDTQIHSGEHTHLQPYRHKQQRWRGLWKHDKSSVLCSTMLRMMMLISMCPPHHHSAWLDWLLVRTTTGNLCLTGGYRNKSLTLGSGRRVWR